VAFEVMCRTGVVQFSAAMRARTDGRRHYQLSRIIF